MFSCSTTLVLHFSAAWSDNCKQIDAVLSELLVELDVKNVTVCSVEAEKCPEISLQYQIKAVPTVVFAQVRNRVIQNFQNSRQIARIDGVHVPELVEKCRAASAKQLTETDGSDPQAVM